MVLARISLIALVTVLAAGAVMAGDMTQDQLRLRDGSCLYDEVLVDLDGDGIGDQLRLRLRDGSCLTSDDTSQATTSQVRNTVRNTVRTQAGVGTMARNQHRGGNN